jgi:hypothetical protein
MRVTYVVLEYYQQNNSTTIYRFIACLAIVGALNKGQKALEKDTVLYPIVFRGLIMTVVLLLI